MALSLSKGGQDHCLAGRTRDHAQGSRTPSCEIALKVLPAGALCNDSDVQ